MINIQHIFEKVKVVVAWLLCIVHYALCISLATSCTDKFDNLEGTMPEWLNENIYDYLQKRGDCNYFVRLIDDEGLTETMRLTGSNTVFFVNDDAFNRFFQNNSMGISSYEQLPASLRKMFLRFGVVENAQLLDRLSHSDHGEILLRRTTNMEVLDTVPVVDAASLPDNEFFERMRKEGNPIRLLQDGTKWTLVQFFPEVMSSKGITDEDLQFITKSDASASTPYIYSNPVITQDIVCKNGYLHELQDVLLPPENMAGYIRSDSRISQFSKLMDRFCLPTFYSRTESGDTIWEMRYFNDGKRALTADPISEKSATGRLLFDPGWNLYASSSATGSQAAYEQTMACMFVPTDEAMQEFFSPTGSGADFYNAFGSWDNVPDYMVADIINANMKNNFLQAMPSKFDMVEDENGYIMNISKDNIEDSYIARNGLIYVCNKVFAPQDYMTVIGPAKIDVGNSIFNEAMSNTTYSYYAYLLRAPKNTYYFFVTPDAYMKNYVEPVSQGFTDPTLRATLDFYINKNNNIVATPVSIATGETIMNFPFGSNGVVSSGMRSRMNDILGTHTIVANYDGELEDKISQGQEWFVSNSYAPVHISSLSVGGKVTGTGNSTGLTIGAMFKKSNGRTFTVDGIIQNSTTSIYDVMSSKTEFSEFFNICNAIGVFSSTTVDNNAALTGHRVSFLNQYHYTIYIPTNDAIKAAQTAGKLPTVAQWSSETDKEKKDLLEEKLLRFVRYHFQDNSVFIKGEKTEGSVRINGVVYNDYQTYLSGTLDKSSDKFYPIYVHNTRTDIELKSATGVTANVVKSGGLYNLTAHDIVVNNSNRDKATEIATYAYAVLHQIDKVLEFE